MNIAFIGLGIMGSRMAVRLLKNYSVTVYNRTRIKEEDIIKKGARRADSLEDAVHNKDVVITMLGDPEAVKQTALGSGGFLNHMKEGGIWIDCSTVNPSFSVLLKSTAEKAGIHFIDAPVAGSTIPAEKGELTFLIGGDKEPVSKIMPLLQLMGSRQLHLGSAGMGTSMKMIINNMLAASMASFAESIILGEQLGFSKELLFNTLMGGPVTAPFVSAKREKLISGNYEAQFPIEWMAKDVALALDTAGEKGIKLPYMKAAADIYSAAAKSEFAGKDFSVIYEFLSK